MSHDVKRRPPTQRLALEIVGWLLVAAGLAALVLPGPGLLLLALGLWVHSLSYEWAARVLEPVKRNAYEGAAQSVKTWPRIVMSALSACMVMAAGVYWGIGPPAPGWWPLDADWWLVGGWGTGAILVASGLVALGLIGWSMATFRYGGANIRDVLVEKGLHEDG